MNDAPSPSLHPQCEAIAFLLGTWSGSGKGVYPSIDDFEYREEVRFWHTGRPLLLYAQRTWNAESGAPMHAETGFWRPQEGGAIELVLAHSFGLTEISIGALAGTRIEFASHSLVSAPSAKPVEAVERAYEVRADTLTYSFGMAAAEQPLQGHLRAALRRVADPAGG